MKKIIKKCDSTINDNISLNAHVSIFVAILYSLIVHTGSISWSPSGVDPNMNEHAVYLDDLCGTLSGRLKDMVAKAAHLESPDWDELPPTFRKVTQSFIMTYF